MKYPVFRKRIDDTLVVCFVSEHVGTVIVGNDTFEVGYYSTNWGSAEDRGFWTDWNQDVAELSCVVIENKKDLDEFNIIANSKIVAYCNTFPMVVWKEQHLKNSKENDYFHRTQFKDYVIWSEDREKSKEILGLKTKFELKYDDPVYVDIIGISKYVCMYDNKLIGGKYRTNEKQAQLALKSQIRQMRLGALIDQCGGQKEFIRGEKNWSLYETGNIWLCDCSTVLFCPEKIYCNKETAKKARDILNKDEYNLEAEE